MVRRFELFLLLALGLPVSGVCADGPRLTVEDVAGMTPETLAAELAALRKTAAPGTYRDLLDVAQRALAREKSASHKEERVRALESARAAVALVVARMSLAQERALLAEAIRRRDAARADIVKLRELMARAKARSAQGDHDLRNAAP